MRTAAACARPVAEASLPQPQAAGAPSARWRGTVGSRCRGWVR